jgi:hypothetical protein
MAAGIQPIIVICKMRQTNPEIGRPIVKKVTNGKRIANKRRIIDFLRLEKLMATDHVYIGFISIKINR